MHLAPTETRSYEQVQHQSFVCVCVHSARSYRQCVYVPQGAARSVEAHYHSSPINYRNLIEQRERAKYTHTELYSAQTTVVSMESPEFAGQAAGAAEMRRAVNAIIIII